MKMIKKLQNFDSWIGSTKIYSTIESACNYLLIFSTILVVLMFIGQLVHVLHAMEGIN